MRRSIRLHRYDYTFPGAYFVTVVSQDRQCLFGEVVGGVVQLSVLGTIVREEWFRSPLVRPYLQLETDELVVMPNHIHGIIRIMADDVGAQRRCAPTTHASQPRVIARSLGAIVRAFKSSTTRRINRLRSEPGSPLWQRNYFEHIIRNEEELARIRQYIIDNPLQWQLDREHPGASHPSSPSSEEPWREILERTR